MRLKIQLPTNWAQQENPNGPATFSRQGSTSVFQVSWAEYRGGKLPAATAEELKEMAVNFGQKQGFGEMLESTRGECPYGKFGTAAFSSQKYPRIQVWFISDGRDHMAIFGLVFVRVVTVAAAAA